MTDLLWAEDSEQDRLLVRAALEELRRRPRITFVDDGAALLKALATTTPRVIVLDLSMTGMDGLETLARIRDSPAWRDLPVVVFTSSSHPNDVAACERLGVVDYVTKPMAFEQFCGAVERVLATMALTKVA